MKEKQASGKKALSMENGQASKMLTKKGQKQKIQLSTSNPGIIQNTTFSLAYKIPRSRIIQLLSEVEDTQFGRMVGLQVSFRERTVLDNGTVTWPLRPKVKFNKVYFKLDPENTNDSFFNMTETVDFVTAGEAFLIDENLNTQSGEIWSSLNTSFILEDTEYLYKKLDFFPTDDRINFVFFTLSQLKGLTHFFNELIFSGAQIQLGRKLHHPPEKPRTFGNPRFTLKIEGTAPLPNWSSRKKKTRQRTPTETWEETTGEAALFGHPCPPVWETFNAVVTEITNNDPNSTAFLMANFAKVWEDWQTKVLLVNSTSEYDDTFDT